MMKSLIFLLAVVVSLVFVGKAFAEVVKVNGQEYHLEKMVSQYHTIFNHKNKARTTNILMARKSINGLLVKPGDAISFNELVGPRTKEAGFLEAASFANGKKVTSFGGGICQLASTWSAATINMKLKIIERHRHSLPVTYIPADKEATVAYGVKDFKFKNTSQDILYVKCFIKDNNNLYVEYWRCKKA